MDEQYEEFVHVLHIYDGQNGECAFGHDHGSYGILTGDDELIKPVGFINGSMYAALRALYGDIPIIPDREVIPFQIALAGKPAMATYHYMAHFQYYTNLGPRHDEGKRELAENMGVSRETVQKYFRRVAKDASEIKIGGTSDRHLWR
ncbi:hypothetical protein EXE46_12055 [Halorubrum sp. GN11_10-6_MGM]|uniref:hypothetical protein n=1 Tax=Halorubrum sp. GN11_10-6_MGM TaxID=2518112 RepID=UPI0010F982CE|nr:hypothetical protein [Halorubrum sp. GN11_10-6_MGM]TKX73905.1 hypothetical protein EXE46_12055 [Halorubrum sp. GN11_10-6_MGM]